MGKRITLKEASSKYGIITTGANRALSYYLAEDGRVLDSAGDVRFIPQYKCIGCQAELVEGYAMLCGKCDKEIDKAENELGHPEDCDCRDCHRHYSKVSTLK